MAMPRHELLALIERIKEQDKKVKAWRAFPDENALNCPPNGDFQNAVGPLSGLTVGVKDIIDVVGIPTRHGSAIYENALPALADAECVALMRAAGATIVGKTVTTELATFVPSVTRNPRNLDHTPGGSSSGSAAAVAAGHVDIAIGTQTAGSIIRPAAYCGVFGFKPSFGLVPRGGVKIQSETLDTVGVFARSIAHCEAWLAAMMQVSCPEVAHTTEEGLLRIAIITDMRDLASHEMRSALMDASGRLAAAGHDVNELDLPSSLARLSEHQAVIQNYEAARAYKIELAIRPAALSPKLQQELENGNKITHRHYFEALTSAVEARDVATTLFAGIDVMLLPAAPGAAPTGNASTGSPSFNRLASALHAPVLNVSAPSGGGGLPLGIQVIGAYGTDMQFLENAKKIYVGITRPSR